MATLGSATASDFEGYAQRTAHLAEHEDDCPWCGLGDECADFPCWGSRQAGRVDRGAA